VELTEILNGLDEKLKNAIKSFWDVRAQQLAKNNEGDSAENNNRGAVTGGKHMEELEKMFVDLVAAVGGPDFTIKTSSRIRRGPTVKAGMELPGFFRAEKQWDMLVLYRNMLVAAIEFKGQVGSFGNNLNNRSEEAIGTAIDAMYAYKKPLLGHGPKPFFGFFFLVEDCDKSNKAIVIPREPHFCVDDVFKREVNGKGKRGTSYLSRYEILCRRLREEDIYTATCLVCATQENKITEPAADLNLNLFASELVGKIMTFKLLS
jgi:hypothetical protein